MDIGVSRDHITTDVPGSSEPEEELTAPRSISVGILGATLETTNMGVGALAAGACQCILGAYPQAEIRFIDYARKPSVQALFNKDGQRKIPVINIRFSKRFYLSNNIAMLLLLALVAKLLPWSKGRRWIIARNATLRQIQDMTFVASIAGGDSFSDIYGIERLLYVSLPQILVLLLGTPLVLLPQTIGPFRRRFAKAVARYILDAADRIYSRDFRGIEALNKLTDVPRKANKVDFCYDVGFVLEPVAPILVDVVGLSSFLQQSRPLVGLNVSGLLLMGGYSRRNMFGLKSDYRELIRDLIAFLINEKRMSVLLLPHVMSQQQPENDVNACQEFFDSLGEKYKGRLGVLQGHYNQNEVKFVIGQCDFLIGARMHACIAAVSQCVPAICMAYSDKFIGVMETIGVENIVVDARQLDTTEMLPAIGQALDRRQEVRRLLQAKMPEVRASIMNLLSSETRADGKKLTKDKLGSRLIPA